MKNRDNILRLKYRLEPKENDMVEFQILEQDKKLTAQNKYLPLGNFNGWSISSDMMPDIYYDGYPSLICLRGRATLNGSRIATFEGHYRIPSIHKALEEMVKKLFGNCRVIKS